MQVKVIKTYIFVTTFEILTNYDNYCLQNRNGILETNLKELTYTFFDKSCFPLIKTLVLYLFSVM